MQPFFKKLPIQQAYLPSYLYIFKQVILCLIMSMCKMRKNTRMTSGRLKRESNPSFSQCHFICPISWTNFQTGLIIACLLMCICLYCLVRNLISHATSTAMSLQFNMHFDYVFYISLKSHLFSQYHMLLICRKALKHNEKGIITNEKACADKQPPGIQVP